MAATQVLIISRLATQNAGNEALSTELINYVTARLDSAVVRALDRYPRYFEQFGLAGLGQDPVPAFEVLVRRLLHTFYREDAPKPSIASPALVKLDRTGTEMTGLPRRLKRRLGVRRRLAALGIIERNQSPIAVTACASADLVVWNPAGEIRPTPTSADHVVRLLLLLRIAQVAGRKTAVINHSLELVDGPLRTLVAHVYSKLDYIGLRDARSVEVAKSLGLSSARIYESPDLVFLASRSSPGQRSREGAIGLAINGLEALAGEDEWERLMLGLRRTGRPLLFVSNAVNHDRDFARHLARLAGMGEVVGEQPDYLSLRSYFQSCSVLVSSRLHSSILALCEGVPVVSIEPSLFKLSAIFQQMDYPLPTQRIQEQGWSQQVLRNVENCLGDPGDALSAMTPRVLETQTRRIDSAYAPLFQLLEKGQVSGELREIADAR